MSINDRLEQLGYRLPAPRSPIGSYLPALRLARMVYTSGQVSGSAERDIKGKLGDSIELGEGQEAARMAVLNALAAIQAEIGSLDAIQRVVRLVVYVCSADSFTRQPEVANGASDLLTEIFGEAGRHVRAAVGVNTLPAGYAVELELWVETKGDAT